MIKGEFEYRGNYIVQYENGYRFFLLNVDEEVEEFGYYNSFEEAKNKMDDILNKNPQDYISE
jgi:hypothetical protein